MKRDGARDTEKVRRRTIAKGGGGGGESGGRGTGAEGAGGGGAHRFAINFIAPKYPYLPGFVVNKIDIMLEKQKNKCHNEREVKDIL
ncbi:Hypothetical predicted protein [Octopus vulgaris]|uniref:Uncharacterized protein n=1 Tax=Octopus vulgaris TaxID=6645 RepID=A0AA36BH50_OCTVU|nr:Hypothetical predicted protein [Octopus vulgaris]